MIDLDELEDSTEVDELYCHLGAALLSGRMSYASWCTLTMFCGVYQQLEDRQISEDFIQSFERLHRKPGDISWLNKLQCAVISIDRNYTIEQQTRVGEILEGKLRRLNG